MEPGEREPGDVGQAPGPARCCDRTQVGMVVEVACGREQDNWSADSTQSLKLLPPRRARAHLDSGEHVDGARRSASAEADRPVATIFGRSENVPALAEMVERVGKQRRHVRRLHADDDAGTEHCESVAEPFREPVAALRYDTPVGGHPRLDGAIEQQCPRCQVAGGERAVDGIDGVEQAGASNFRRLPQRARRAQSCLHQSGHRRLRHDGDVHVSALRPRA
jgi:hypothetical protein